MATDPLAALRAELEARGLEPAHQPDADMLRAILDVEQGDTVRAARAISDAQLAEDHRTNASPGAAHTPHTAHTDAAPAADALPEPRGVVPRASIWDSAPIVQLWRVVSMPFSMLQTVVVFCLRALRLWQPFPPNTRGQLDASRFAQDPRESARAWIAALERDTNATVDSDPVRPQLPPFFAGSYADALRHAKDEIQILAIVLTSPAHSDDLYFKQHVLTDRQLVATLRTPEFCVWGGDVRAREAYQVSALLKASTFPFVAFVALQPRRSRARGTVVAHPAVLSRLEGSPHAALSAQSLCTHIHEVLLPRTATYLGHLRSERRHRERERQLKADQDRAYEEASRRDQARVLERRAEVARRAEDERAREAAAAAHAALLAKQAHWRRWASQGLVPAEPAPGAPCVRLSVHLPSGRNLQRRFAPDATLEHVYAYVDTAEVSGDGAVAPPADYVHQYAFQLVQTYPRRLLDTYHLATPLHSIPGLEKGANLIVETPHGPASDSSDEE